MQLTTQQEVLLGWLASGLANAITSSLLNPLDIIKTRMQMNSQINNYNINSKLVQPTFYQVFLKIYRQSGLIGLWTPGLLPTIYREILNSGPRAGLYVPILAAFCSGTVGAVLSNPIDVIKVRCMIHPQLYPNTYIAFKTIYRNENINGFYKGFMPSSLRAAFIAVATYDHAKHSLKQYFKLSSSQKDESVSLHIIASLITGLVAAIVAAPFDVLKTRLMNTIDNNNIKMISTLHNIIKHEGVYALYRGWLPSYLRLGPHALICFPIFEKLRYIVGLDYI